MNHGRRPNRLVLVTRPALVPSLLAAAVLALAGCGGGDDNGDEESGGTESTPAETILADAGLEVCSQEQEQISQSTIGPGLSAIVAFAVAEDCAGKETSPDIIRVLQFSDRQSVNAGAAAAKQAYPRSIVMISGALVIVVSGPNRDKNADSVGNAYTGATGVPVRTI
jgi:hypothetical protein